MPSRHLPDGYFPYRGIPKTTALGREGFNAYGYIGDDPTVRKTLNIQFLGCSWTMPPLIAMNDGFPNHTCRHLADHFGVDVANWNMGLGGNSFDTMVRTLICSVDLMLPDFVFLLLPGMDRHEYFRGDNGQLIRYQIDYIHEEKNNGRHWKMLDVVARDVMRNFNALNSSFNEAARMLKNLILVDNFLSRRGIPWGFGVVPVVQLVECVEEIMEAGWVDRRRYIGQPYHQYDMLAPDDSHPGSISRSQFGRLVFEWMIAAFGDHLAESVRLGRTSGEAGA